MPGSAGHKHWLSKFRQDPLYAQAGHQDKYDMGLMAVADRFGTNTCNKTFWGCSRDLYRVLEGHRGGHEHFYLVMGLFRYGSQVDKMAEEGAQT